MNVEIPETLFFKLVDLLREPKTLDPSRKECVIHLEKRNDLLDHLMVIRRNVVALEN